jgi:4-aminobutyrate aminotransferase-like enzyme
VIAGEVFRDTVCQVPAPDVYRGCYRGDVSDGAIGRKYADFVQTALEGRHKTVAAFMCESVLGCAGQVTPTITLPSFSPHHVP